MERVVIIVFDIESNGLLDSVSKIHCIQFKDRTNGKTWGYRPNEIGDGITCIENILKDKVSLGGHNIINYDIPAIQKVYPRFDLKREQRELIRDSYVMSMLIYGNIKEMDYPLLRKGKIPAKLVGTHKLAAWGYRLGNNKGDYGEQENAWDVFTEEMYEYCAQDVNLNCDIFDKLEANTGFPQFSIEMEHRAQWLLAQMERNGFPFDKGRAEELVRVLRTDLAVAEQKIIFKIPEIPAKWDELTGEVLPSLIPKRDNKTRGYKAGVPVFKTKDFNPGSRKQIEYIVRHKFGYDPMNEDLYDIPDMPDVFDPKDYRLKIDDETFTFIASDTEAPKELRELSGSMAEYLLVKKRLGQISDGNKAWFKFYNEETGSIHGRVISNGTVSGRASHSNPNVAQVPAVRAEYGHECRAVWNADHKGNGWVQVGTDAAGLELRCLAHYMATYDNGAYGDIILNGDIHTANQTAAGLPTRDDAKTFIYAFLYGAGDAKIGRIVGKDKKAGKALKKAFLSKTPAIKDLREAVENVLVEMERGRVKRWKRKYLKGLDGRPLWVRSPHSALNLLLQSCGALICKLWTVITEDKMIERGYKHGWDGDFAYLMWIHDEMQVACRTTEIAEEFLVCAQEAMREVGDIFKIRIQLDTDGKIGKNWADCH